MTKLDRPSHDQDRVSPVLRVGLVNNMPDAALAPTERQFRQLLQAAAPDHAVELSLFEIPGIHRDPTMRARMEARYRPAERIAEADLDALVVTGAKHEHGALQDAPFWPGLAHLVDLALDLALPTLWSCLAAHAAVEHLDGLKRRPLPEKYSGLFACEPVAGQPLLEGVDRVWSVPHSRFNDIAEADLVGRGYEILTRSAQVGVDAFVRRGPPLFLFCQGHPEYGPDSLTLEYKRDFRAFVHGERAAPPAVPAGAFDVETEENFARLTRAALENPSPDLMAAWPSTIELRSSLPEWRTFAVGLYGNWLRATV